jgi:hypothetical protein
MPISCKCILDHLVYKGAMTEEERDKIVRNLKTHKTGKWVLVEMGDTNLYECSLCRKRKTYTPPFCEICGARMEGAEE